MTERQIKAISELLNYLIEKIGENKGDFELAHLALEFYGSCPFESWPKSAQEKALEQCPYTKRPKILNDPKFSKREDIKQAAFSNSLKPG
jgi:hypothetical protein